jgi:SAM-dependent methyltransferase
MTTMPSGSSGRESEDGWNSTAGRHWVQHEDRHDRMLAPLTSRLMGTAGISRTDKILDIGCGCGETSRIAAQQATEGEVLGVDISAPMLAQARLRAEEEGLANLRFEEADAAAARLPDAYYDLVLSRFGVMFFEDAKAAFENISRSLRPGGRLTFLCWQEVMKNEHIVVPFGVLAAHAPVPDIGTPDAPGPFSLADPERIRALLTGAGCTDIKIEPLHERLRLGSDVPDVLAYFRDHPAGSSSITAMDDATLAKVVDELIEAIRPFQTPEGVFFGSAAWLVTARH